MYVLLIVVCPFVLFLLAIVLSVLLRYTDSDCPFGIFKIFLIQVLKLYCNKINKRHIMMMSFLYIVGQRLHTLHVQVT